MPWSTLHLVAFTADADPFREYAGSLLVSLLLAWGISRCIQISRRPATNTTAALALAVTLCVWFLTQAARVLKGIGLSSGLSLLLVPVVLSAMFAGGSLAIVGLREIKRSPQLYSQGRKQAWWSLALTSLFALLVMAGIAGRLESLVEKRAGLSEGTSEAEPVVFEDLNFRFTPPDSSWAAMDNVEALNEEATVGYLRSEPSTVFLIVAESFPDIGAEITAEGLADVVRANLRSHFKEVGELGIEPLDSNGLDGSLVLSRARVNGAYWHIAHWVHRRNDFVYQLMAGGEASALGLDDLRLTVTELIGGFELIAPGASYMGPGAELIGSYRSSRYGFALDLSDTRWRLWEDVGTEWQHAQFAGLLEGTAAFVVIPVYLGELRPDVEALAKALAARIDISLEDEAISHLELFSESGVDGLSFRFREEDFDYRFRVLRGADRALLIAAWKQLAGSKSSESPLLVVDRLELLPADGPPADSSELSEAERWTHTLVFNDIGIHYYNAARYARGGDYFHKALEMDTRDPQVLENLVDTLTLQERFSEALELLETSDLVTHDAVSLRSYHAFLQARTGDLMAAASTYAVLFAAGYESDSDLGEYVDVLRRLDRRPLALLQVEAYRKTRDSVFAASLAADLHEEAGEYDRAVQVLSDALEQRPFSRELALALVETCYQGERYEEAIQRATSLLDRGLEAHGLLLLRGQSELALGRYEQARTSFEDAAEADSQDGTAQVYLAYLEELAESRRTVVPTGP